MDNLRGLLGISRRDRVLKVWIRELCRVMQGIGERIDEGILLGLPMWKEWRSVG